jgi:exopolyphosphatase / guanosine-5'-triphosphate,3'-diphosphate pyrophosphatase
MPELRTIAAIDAGSNAIRLVIARVESPSRLRVIEAERYPLRLGRRVFIQHRFDKQAIEQAVKAFRHFRSLMDLHDVSLYRAVATSAVREAANQGTFLNRIYDASRIKLEVIDGEEEARLVRRAVESAVPGDRKPPVMADLGGGSLEISIAKRGEQQNLPLPLGVVRLMELFRVDGAISAEQARLIRSYVRSMLQRRASSISATRSGVAATGGNAEALALLAPGPALHGIRTLDLTLLHRKLPQLLGANVRERMKLFHIRKDRAEVIAIGALVLTTLGQRLHVNRFLVPGVGVKDGVLLDLLRAPRTKTGQQRSAEESLLASARSFAERFGSDARHSEAVRQLAVSLFDQLQPLHKMGTEMRLVLQVAAATHDIGHIIGERLHYKHAEYLVRNGDIPGLDPARRNMAGCIVRYHSERYHSEPGPSADHKLFNSFPRKQQLQIRALIALLRVADALDFEHHQQVTGIQVGVRKKSIHVRVHMKRASEIVLWAASRKARLLESVLDRPIGFVLA